MDHTNFVANLRIVLEVEVQAGNQTATSYAQPGLWTLLDGLDEKSRPVFLRGDCNWGTDRAMEGAEERKMGYVFKLKQSAKVKKLIGRLFQDSRWKDAGQGWQGLDEQLQLMGWTRKRRVVILRRPLRRSRAVEGEAGKSQGQLAKQLVLDLPELSHSGVLYEYAVIVTSLTDEVRTIAQHYRDRGDSENNFDELKNQWAWTGFTTRPQAMPNHGAHHRIDLQLVDHLHAPGNPGQACRGRDQPPIGVAWNRTTNTSQQSNHCGDHQHALQGGTDCDGAHESQCVSEANQSNRGAVGRP
jgi:hypothetical protein